MKKDNNRLLAKEWFDKAEEDILYARAGIKETTFYGLACFHCQQAVEKYLKGYLLFMGKNVHKIHLIRSLIYECVKIDKDLDKFKDYCNTLDTYYISPRYPVIHTVYSKEQANEAVNMAEEIMNFIKIKTGEIK